MLSKKIFSHSPSKIFWYVRKLTAITLTTQPRVDPLRLEVQRMRLEVQRMPLQQHLVSTVSEKIVYCVDNVCVLCDSTFLADLVC